MRHGLAGVPGVLICVALLATGQVWGGGSRVFEISDLRQSPRAVLQGGSLTQDGGAVPPPGRTALLGPSVPVLWNAILAPGGGRVYAAGGAPGTLLSLPLEGEGSVLYQAREAEITALVAQPSGSILAGISPGGRLVEVDPQGEAREVAVSRSSYIWDLEREASGVIWAAAGRSGALLRLDPGDHGFRRVLETGTEQIRCLALDAGGSLLLGTSGNGRIHRLRRSGRLETVLDSDAYEVADLEVDETGGIIAVLVPGGQATPLAAARRSAPARAVPPTPPDAGRGPQPAVPSSKVAGGHRSEVVRIGPDGQLLSLWESSKETALCALARPDGSVWFGTSPRGTLLSVRPGARAAEMTRLPVRSITSLSSLPDGRILVTTGGPGTVVIMDPLHTMEGTVISPVHDAGQGAHFGRAEWWSRAGPAGEILLSLRSGNTSEPDSSWSPWSPWRKGGMVEAPGAPSGRFVQWKARLSGRPSAASELARVRITYLPPNHAPLLTRLRVLPSGWKLEALAKPPGRRPPGPAPGSSTSTQPSSPGPPVPAAPPRQVWAPGKRTFAWTSIDPDGDALVARVLIRADGEPEFHLLSDHVHDPFLVLDERELSDGGFVVRVELSDLGDNSESRALRTVRDTERFVIDTTPPEFRSLRYLASGGGHLDFQVVDRMSPPRHGRVSLDGSPFKGILPVDGIEDEKTEAYRLNLPGLAQGIHLAVIRVGDSAGNETSARLRFQVQE